MDAHDGAQTGSWTGPMTRHPRLAARHLRTGLFVADLDRPWLDTPFLLQGFLIDREQEMDTLRELCAYVYIDIALSDPLAVRHVRELLDAALGPDDRATGPAKRSEGSADDGAPQPAPDVDGALADADPLAIIDYAIPEQGPAPATEPGTATAPGFELVDDGPSGVATSRPSSALEQSAASARHAGSNPAAAVPQPHRTGPRLMAASHGGGGDGLSRPPRSALGATLGNLVKLLRKPLTRAELLAAIRGQLRGADAPGADGAPAGPPPKLSTHVDSKLIGKAVVAEGEVLRASERKLEFDADASDIEQRDLPGRGRRVSEAQAELDRELDAILPPGSKRTFYQPRSTIAEEMPRARKAFETCVEALETVLADIGRQANVPLEQAREAVGDMVESMLDNPDAIMWIAQLRETHLDTYQHCVRVSLYMIAVGRTLGLPREMIEALGQVGILADAGKTRLPRALLDKPGMLTPVEYKIAQDHVRLGLKALAAEVPLAPEVQAGIAEHHERIDGSGYPRALKGTQISIWGRIAGIADCFSALITERPYAKAMAPQDALMSLYEWAGTAFHPPLVEQFVQSIGVFPVGSLVELSNGEVAVVLAQNRTRRLEPRVIVLADAQKNPIPQPFERDLFRQAAVRGAKPLRIQRGLPAGAYGLKPHDYYADQALASNQAA
jgi:HD-GYP domain-containing protein (c-di-GMP phosphodiesterase class II)